MDRERAHAMRLAACVERKGEERFGRFRLPVRDPLVVSAPLKVWIVEVDCGAEVSSRGKRDHSRAVRASQRRPKSRRELEVAEMVGGELRLDAAGVPRQRSRHDARVVDESMDGAAGGEESLSKRVD